MESPERDAGSVGMSSVTGPVAASAPSPRGGRAHTVVVVLASALVVALACAAVAFGTYRAGLWSFGGADPTQRPQTSSNGGRNDAGAESGGRGHASEPVAELDADALDGIVAKYSTSDAAVAVMPSSTADPYLSEQANSRFVAAGLYLPIYLAAHATGNDSAVVSADAMMRTMDNDDGNSAIDGLGGLAPLNSWLGNAGYSSTTFSRRFGDVAASESGNENYSSAADAARMLMAADQDGGTSLMSVDLAAEGVNVPAGVTVHAHRGQGIKDAYNYFVFVSTDDGAAGVAVMTRNLGHQSAAALTGEVLDQVCGDIL